ncbi:MAG: hypothetical protein ACR2GH_13850 [Pseudonocardia sp.]
MSTPWPAGTVHLLVVDDALTDGHRTGTYIAACGALVFSFATSSCHPDYGDCHYYPACVREADRWNLEASQPIAPESSGE